MISQKTSVSFRLTLESLKELAALAKEYRLSKTATIETIIRNEHWRLLEKQSPSAARSPSVDKDLPASLVPSANHSPSAEILDHPSE